MRPQPDNVMAVALRVGRDYWAAAGRDNWYSFIILAVGFFLYLLIEIPFSLGQVVVSIVVSALFAALITYGFGAIFCAWFVSRAARAAGLPLRDFVRSSGYAAALDEYVKDSKTKWW
jgi:hypothetical protein